MPHKFDPKDLERLDSEARRKSTDIESILSSLPLDPGQSVADIGCGTGFFSVPLSRALSQGKVYALDIADEMLERVRLKVLENGISNIEVVKSGEMDFPVPAGDMDGVFLAFVLHEQEDRTEFLRKVRDLLKPSGWLSVIEWQKKEMRMGPPLADRIDEAGLRDLASRAGFLPVSVTNLDEFNYLALLRRTET
ncbi:MAG: class I SAM-dependent methyltransferase [Dehalococcoidia bacterium]|nr:class I SAM-dependent methyltransferase [Dehalococcoidia bacterium]